MSKLSFHDRRGIDHAAHRTEKCERCHQARPSKDAADVLVPPLANCRECHGDPGTRGRLGTACVDCHGFHIARHTFYGVPVPDLAEPPAPEPAREPAAEPAP